MFWDDSKPIFFSKFSMNWKFKKKRKENHLGLSEMSHFYRDPFKKLHWRKFRNKKSFWIEKSKCFILNNKKFRFLQNTFFPANETIGEFDKNSWKVLFDPSLHFWLKKVSIEKFCPALIRSHISFLLLMPAL